MILNTCIGCGCDEVHACANTEPLGEEGGCWWMRFSAKDHAGVCSECRDLVQHWDRGGRAQLPATIAERFQRQLMFLYEDQASARAWLDAPHPQLGGRSPRDLIEIGQLEPIYAVIDQLRDGVYG